MGNGQFSGEHELEYAMEPLLLSGFVLNICTPLLYSIPLISKRITVGLLIKVRWKRKSHLYRFHMCAMSLEFIINRHYVS